MNVSLVAFSTPWAPIVRTPQVTCRQSISLVPPSASGAANRAPGTATVALNDPSSPRVPPFASTAVCEPGNATKTW